MRYFTRSNVTFVTLRSGREKPQFHLQRHLSVSQFFAVAADRAVFAVANQRVGSEQGAKPRRVTMGFCCFGRNKQELLMRDRKAGESSC